MKYEKISLSQPEETNPNYFKRIQLENEEFFEAVDAIPEQQTDKSPVMLSPGWGANPQTMSDMIGSLVADGHRVISPNFSRKKIIEKAERKDAAIEHLQQAHQLNILQEQKGIDMTDLIAHSQGCISAILAALENPEMYRNIILCNPAGMIGQDNTFKLVSRFLNESNKTVSQIPAKPGTFKPIANYTLQLIKTISMNPAMALREIGAIAESDIYDILHRLKSTEAGKKLKIIVVSGKDDQVFPSEKISAQLKDSPVVDAFHVLSGGHGKVIFESSETWREIQEIVNKIESENETSS